MGSDRHMETRMIAENNFWQARSLLERCSEFVEDVVQHWEGHPLPSEHDAKQLVMRIDEFLERTEQR